MKRKILCLFLVFLAVIGLSSCNNDYTNKDTISDNNRVMYQIFVGSFSDSNGDGVGDIRGIITRLDYLNDGNTKSGKSLGVQGLWLSPIFKSNSYHKYDAIDYYEVDPQFGTMDDLKELIEECHKRNVIVILDLAINHTSSSSEWFTKFVTSRRAGDTENEYYDYYTCVRASQKAEGRTYQSISSTNFYYECNFSTDMPELNFDNQKVRDACFNVCKYYLDLGIDGFRYDAVKYIYFHDDAKSIAFWNEFNARIKEVKSDAFLVGEMWDSDSLAIKYCESMSTFSFSGAMAEGYIAQAANGSSNSINTFTRYASNYITDVKKYSEDARFSAFIANHDMDRAAGFIYQYGSPQMAANLYLLCAGSPTIYYGEEIMMKGSRGGAQTDANRRLAMLWGDKDNVSDPSGATYDSEKQINGTVKSQLKDKNSILNYYGKVISFRNKYSYIARGEYSQLSLSNAYVGGFVIKYEGQTHALIHNTDSEEITVDLSKYSDYSFTKLVDSIGMGKASLDGTMLTISGKTSVVLD